MNRAANSSQGVVAIVLCAGQGTRMGHRVNKILLPIEGEPMFLYAVKTFEQCEMIDEILLVSAVGEQDRLLELARAAGCCKVQHVIWGGATRHASEHCALDFLRPRIVAGDIGTILIHDGARPFITIEKVELLIEKASAIGGAILAIPLQEEEHIMQIDEAQQIQRSIDGEKEVWKAQTPQAFRAGLLLEAYDQAENDQFQGTDTASVLERTGCRIAIVEGDENNLKVTTAYDLFHAERLIQRYRS